MRHDSEEYLQHLDHSIKEIGRKGFQQEITDGFSRKTGGLFPLVYHTHDSRFSPAGFPDTQVPIPPDLWYFPPPPRLLVIEAKVGDKKPSPEQIDWLKALAANGAWTFCFWPRHRPVLQRLYEADWAHPLVQGRLHIYEKRGQRNGWED